MVSKLLTLKESSWVQLEDKDQLQFEGLVLVVIPIGYLKFNNECLKFCLEIKEGNIAMKHC